MRVLSKYEPLHDHFKQKFSLILKMVETMHIRKAPNRRPSLNGSIGIGHLSVLEDIGCINQFLGR